MPDCEYNYLSWSFGLAFVGVVMMYVTAVLFLVEAPIMQRKGDRQGAAEKAAVPHGTVRVEQSRRTLVHS